MGNSQGKQKRKITSQDRAILDLKIQRDKLKLYQRKIQTVLDREVEIAKQQLQAGNKRRALLALKKKKYQEQLLEKTDGQLLNLEELVNSIEFALVEKEVLAGLSSGNEVLKEIHQEMSIDAVEKLMDETADAIAYQNEIEELLSGKITEEDEEDILRQLDEIEKQAIDEQMDVLPQVPENKLPEPQPIEDEEEEEEEKEERPEPARVRAPKKAEPMLAA
ncbi:Snf7-domain-containing protein [Basidiobolus meristosporus CBS 931.73]|uniref:Snf7-domain-containing protein n=1 Tax=Basidiobolus meristosporus CBS 931.73 TaxID=1314790 RepID=A0A1Y1Z3Q2_9FUNG|nr:Snf7-domain-containing protein [Basidiobolus meristosporus CBS 931.73]|eukprot:ORY04734.1 Snf7-domain-containing protein [Basidiobolus meristosporus CBS 931.73]